MTRRVSLWRRKRTPGAPSQPAAPTASNVTNVSATLSWVNAGPGATYLLDRSAGGGAWANVFTGSAVTFNDTGLTPGAQYSYRLTVSVGGVMSEPSDVLTFTTLTVVVAPATPESPAAITVTSTSVALQWTAVPTATSYTLKRGATVVYTGSALTFTNTGLTASTAYSYTLAATNTGGTSAYSPALSVTTPAAATIPATPAAPTSTNVGSTSATLNWTSVAGATAYVLQRSTNQSQWTQVYSGAARTASVTNLSAGTTYYWQVSASNTAGSSAFSPSHSFTTSQPPSAGTVTPHSSKKVWQRYGVQTFPNFGTRVYGRHADAVASYLAIVKDMGVAYVRMQAGGLGLTGVKEQVAFMKANNIKFIGGVVNENFSVSTASINELRASLTDLRNDTELSALCIGIESINEPNHNRGAVDRADGSSSNPVPDDWAFRAVTVNRIMAEEMAETTALDNAKRCGPALHDSAAQKSYQTMSTLYHRDHGGRQHWHQLVNEGILQYIDVQVTHSYPGGEQPLNNYVERENLVTSAYGTGPGGAPYPMWVNEWGYKGSAGSWRDSQYISPTAMQYYDDRAIFIFGIERDIAMCRFELLDDPLKDPDGVVRDDVQKHFGMVETPDFDPATWTRKPSVNRVKAILQALKPHLPRRELPADPTWRYKLPGSPL